MAGVTATQATLPIFEAVPKQRRKTREPRNPEIAGRAAARTPAQQVLEFHKAFALPAPGGLVTDWAPEQIRLRSRLIAEESAEALDALACRDLIALADALADIVYVVYGTAITFGIDLDACVEEVHRSNMSKLDDAGQPVLRADGKVLKSDQYRPPDLRRVLGLPKA